VATSASTRSMRLRCAGSLAGRRPDGVPAGRRPLAARPATAIDAWFRGNPRGSTSPWRATSSRLARTGSSSHAVSDLGAPFQRRRARGARLSGRVFVAPAGPGRLTPVARSKACGTARRASCPAATACSRCPTSRARWKCGRSADGIGDRKQLTSAAAILRFAALPSPDGRWIAHHDKNQDLYLYDTRSARSAGSRTRRAPARGSRARRRSATSRGAPTAAGSPTTTSPPIISVASWCTTPRAVPPFPSRRPVRLVLTRLEPDGKWLFFLSDRTSSPRSAVPGAPGSPTPSSMSVRSSTPWRWRGMRAGRSAPVTSWMRRRRRPAAAPAPPAPRAPRAPPADPGRGEGGPRFDRHRRDRTRPPRGARSGRQLQCPHHGWRAPVLAVAHRGPALPYAPDGARHRQRAGFEAGARDRGSRRLRALGRPHEADGPERPGPLRLPAAPRRRRASPNRRWTSPAGPSPWTLARSGATTSWTRGGSSATTSTTPACTASTGRRCARSTRPSPSASPTGTSSTTCSRRWSASCPHSTSSSAAGRARRRGERGGRQPRRHPRSG